MELAVLYYHLNAIIKKFNLANSIERVYVAPAPT